ncbi:chemotaxis sensory transducer [Skermanella stibiiresistens SB22]|uniref:Chemotaxis sensory transducer n=1 Tax=Skermanella stibiiresistens SB22 TaxID=1385369 RepID=W9H949_9PROT|nr:chemotaxis sensory transducer [Skermanella stibiiresistens SB22]
MIQLAGEVSQIATEKTRVIAGITSRTKILALNAKIEAARAGDAGRSFGVVASEVQAISHQIEGVTQEFREQLVTSATRLKSLGEGLVSSMRGNRLADLALNMIDIIDRNLYERSCDVRWWATDSAVVDCLAGTDRGSGSGRSAFASKRLGVILSSYTVYLDLWIADATGRVVANGRPERYPGVVGTSVASQAWFKDALATRDGTEFTVADIARSDQLGGSAVAIYAAAVREGGEENGRPLGVLGIFFDWEAQARSVVNGIRLTADEQREGRTKCLILNAQHRIIAASDDRYILQGSYPLRTEGRDMGHYEADDGTIVAFALTPGYETYRGLGWYGVILQRTAEVEEEFNRRHKVRGR